MADCCDLIDAPAFRAREQRVHHHQCGSKARLERGRQQSRVITGDGRRREEHFEGLAALGIKLIEVQCLYRRKHGHKATVAGAGLEHGIARSRLRQHHHETCKIERSGELLIADLVFAAHGLGRQHLNKGGQGSDPIGCHQAREGKRVSGQPLLEQLEAVALGPPDIGVAPAKERRCLGIENFSVDRSFGNMPGDGVDRGIAGIVLMGEEVCQCELLMLAIPAPGLPLLFIVSGSPRPNLRKVAVFDEPVVGVLADRRPRRAAPLPCPLRHRPQR